MTELDAASYYDTAFEAAQSALVSGELKEFKYLTQIHKLYLELCHHLRRGGSIH